MNGITTANLGWWIIGLYAAGTVLGWIQDWFGGQYAITRRGFRFCAARRWYGTRARVCLRDAGGGRGPDRYVVLCRDDEDTAVPWLKVHKLNAERLRYWDEDAEPFWAPVTVFAPCEVRRLRPHLTRFGRVRVPWLTRWLPAGGLGGGA